MEIMAAIHENEVKLVATLVPGWRLTSWLVAYGSIVYGLQSLVFPYPTAAMAQTAGIAAV